MGRFNDEDINGKLAEFNKHNPTIIGEPRELTATDIDKRLGGLPKILALTYMYLSTGVDPRLPKDCDIPLLAIVGMARQSGLFDAYCQIQMKLGLDCVIEELRRR